MDPRDAMIRAKSKDIPQDPLPLEWPEPLVKGKRRAKRYVKPVRWIRCPRCTNDKVAVVLTGDNREVIREHTKRLRSGVNAPCPASNTTPLPDH